MCVSVYVCMNVYAIECGSFIYLFISLFIYSFIYSIARLGFTAVFIEFQKQKKTKIEIIV